MRQDTLVGLTPQEAQRRGNTAPLTYTSAPIKKDAESARDLLPRVPYIVREREDGLIYACFLTPDPAKEPIQP